MKKIPEDIAWILDVECPEQPEGLETGELWEEEGTISGGINYGSTSDET